MDTCIIFGKMLCKLWKCNLLYSISVSSFYSFKKQVWCNYYCLLSCQLMNICLIQQISNKTKLGKFSGLNLSNFDHAVTCCPLHEIIMFQRWKGARRSFSSTLSFWNEERSPERLYMLECKPRHLIS